MLDPTQPIRGWEFKVRYVTSSLLASRVFCNDIIMDRTFSCPGSFDNANGTITGMYGLIIGPGNVTEETELMVLTFNISGRKDSNIEFYDSGICNSTQYVNCSFVNYSIDFYFNPMINGWNGFSRMSIWSIDEEGWSSFGNASLAANTTIISDHDAAKPKAPINDAFPSLVSTLIGSVLIIMLCYSMISSIMRR
jgi:hypothetical protein